MAPVFDRHRLRMSRLPALVVVAGALALVATACGSDSSPSSTATKTSQAARTTTTGSGGSGAGSYGGYYGGSATTTTAAPTMTTTPQGATSATAGRVAVGTTGLGRVLVDDSGRTLYAFQPDSPTMSACTGQCATNWPPLAGPVGPGAGVAADKLGSIQRADGTKQATYNGHPLYRFAGDKAAGDTAGQGIGGVWHVLGADGQLITS